MFVIEKAAFATLTMQIVLATILARVDLALGGIIPAQAPLGVRTDGAALVFFGIVTQSLIEASSAPVPPRGTPRWLG